MPFSYVFISTPYQTAIHPAKTQLKWAVSPYLPALYVLLNNGSMFSLFYMSIRGSAPLCTYLLFECRAIHASQLHTDEIKIFLCDNSKTGNDQKITDWVHPNDPSGEFKRGQSAFRNWIS